MTTHILNPAVRDDSYDGAVQCISVQETTLHHIDAAQQKTETSVRTFLDTSGCPILPLDQGAANFLSRGPKNEMISLGGPQLLSKKKHSAFF